MKYKDLIETIQIVAKYNGGLDEVCCEMWAEHDEHGINIKDTSKVSVEDIRRLAEIGWQLGCDADYDEEDSEKWENYKNLSDEELVELFSKYDSIYKFE